MWYLKRSLLFTKDNLDRRNWIGSKVYSFSGWEKSIQHLFYCAYTKFLWCAIHLVFYLTSSKDIDDLFDQWLKQEGHKSNYTY